MPTIATLGAASARAFGLFGSTAGTDPYFFYNTLLLPGNGTDGAQNNTFLDSSTNNFTITRNGNTTQGTFTPYGANWSNYFTASSGDCLVNTSSALASTTASTFTAEAWVFLTATPSNASFPSMGTVITLDGAKASANIYMSFGVTTSNTISLYWYDGSSKACIGSTTLTLNQWTHIAASVNSNTIKLFVNGVSETLSGTTTLTNRASATNTFAVGGNYYSTTPAYISNARVTNTAVYTSNFTPPTAPLTAITNTSLLTCQSNRFIDNSSNAFALTVNGSPSVQRFSPFNPTTPYAAGTIGGSGYFDGSGDYLSGPNNAAFAFGTGDFTIEAWVNSTNYSGTNAIFDSRSAGNEATGVILYIRADGKPEMYRSAAVVTGSTALSQNTWNHVALTRSGSTCTLWLNGVSIGTATDATNLTQQNSFVGAAYTGINNLMVGYIANLRVVKGTAVYTSAFTPPTSPLTAITNTSLLCSFTNGGIIDNTMMNDLETVGNAQISTTQSKFGGSSMYFDGTTSNRIRPPASVNYAFGTGNFTVEAWVYVTNLTTENFVFDTRSSVSTAGMGFSLEPNTGKLRYSGSANNVLTSTGVSANTWTHVAWVRNSGTLTGYINGVSGGSASNSDNLTQTNGEVGNVPFSAVGTNMYIDDLRITKGIARYTSNFTPPTAAFPLS